MLFSVFYVGDSCQGWGREFESPFPLNLKSPDRKIGAFFALLVYKSSKYIYTLYAVFTQSAY